MTQVSLKIASVFLANEDHGCFRSTASDLHPRFMHAVWFKSGSIRTFCLEDLEFGDNDPVARANRQMIINSGIEQRALGNAINLLRRREADRPRVRP